MQNNCCAHSIEDPLTTIKDKSKELIAHITLECVRTQLQTFGKQIELHTNQLNKINIVTSQQQFRSHVNLERIYMIAYRQSLITI